MLICVVMLLIATIIWRPRNFGRYSFRALRPKYKSLGAPIPVLPIPGVDDFPCDLGPRGVAEGAPAYQTESVRFELENFNVRTLYDKLEDQTLHVTSQLARHQADLRGFYERISQQAENLKQMLNNMDVTALIEATKEAASHNVDKLHSVGEDEDKTIKHEIFLGGGNREEELMKTLHLLVEKIDTGVRPVVMQHAESMLQHGESMLQHGNAMIQHREQGKRMEASCCKLVTTFTNVVRCNMFIISLS